jgi:hypothetical protein
MYKKIILPTEVQLKTSAETNLWTKKLNKHETKKNFTTACDTRICIFSNLAGTGVCVRYLGGSGGVEIPVLLPALAGVPLHLHHAAGLATTILVNEDDLLLRFICSTLERIINLRIYLTVFRIRILSGQWIRIRIRNPGSRSRRAKMTHKSTVEKIKKFHVLKCWMFSLEC